MATVSFSQPQMLTAAAPGGRSRATIRCCNGGGSAPIARVTIEMAAGAVR